MRYALISFLNARPLWWGIVRGEDRAEESYTFSSPAECARIVAAGEADLGLIPAIELARNPDLVCVPGLCIASESEVRSVLLVARVPFTSIRSVLLDPASRTSVALCRILLAERLGRQRFSEIRFDAIDSTDDASRSASVAGLLVDHDAAVVIGDPALVLAAEVSDEPGVHIFDLASEWRREFDEPFVFGVWAGHRDRLARFAPSEIAGRLHESLQFGLDRIDDIVAEAAVELGLPTNELTEYFARSLHYSMGDEELSALARFHSLARKYGLAENGDNTREIKWLR